MKKEKLLVLSSLIILISSCQSPGAFFNRPKIIPTISNVGTGFRNGQEIDTTNFICVDPSEYDILQEYYNDKEYRLFLCLRYNRCK
jgi:hypothetical protein